MSQKRPWKDISCMSQNYLRKLCKLESDLIFNAFNTTVNTDNIHDTHMRYSENVCTMKSDQPNEDVSKNDFVHEVNQNNNDISVLKKHCDKYTQLNNYTSDSQLSISSEESISLISENANITDTDFKRDLVMWAIKHQISHTATTSLLQILRQHSCFSTLSLHAKSLLKTPRKQEIRTVAPGIYYHFGLQTSIIKIITSVKDKIDCVKIIVNVDGLPLTRSSQQQFWPILGSILPYDNVFVIGIYHGNEKPADANDFLKDFVKEAKEICEKGVHVNGRNIPCKIEALICDAPAKAFVLCVKGHCGYSSCTKCTTEGDYLEKRMCFPQIDAPLRSDDDFIKKVDDSYHKPGTTCSLLNIPGFKPVSNVPLDYMHLICLGIMRKLLNLWLYGKLHYRLQHRAVDKISTRLVTQFKCYIPVEFARKPRKLDCIKLWKATEYRLLLLYTGPLAFKSILKKNIYTSFLTLFVIIRILSSQNLHEYLSYAQDLILYFVKIFTKLYGVENVSHNIHSLIHLVDDVKKFGPIDNFSAFKFENYLQILKKYIRKAEKPLQQVIHRYKEKEINSDSSSTISSNSILIHPTLMLLHYDGPLIPYCNNPQYKIVKYNGIMLKAGTLANSCCGLNNGAIVSIENIAYCTKRNVPVIIGHEFLKKDNLFNIPCPSSLLGIYLVYLDSEMKSWPLKNVISKYVKLPCKDNKFAVFPLIHTKI